MPSPSTPSSARFWQRPWEVWSLPRRVRRSRRTSPTSRRERNGPVGSHGTGFGFNARLLRGRDGRRSPDLLHWVSPVRSEWQRSSSRGNRFPRCDARTFPAGSRASRGRRRHAPSYGVYHSGKESARELRDSGTRTGSPWRCCLPLGSSCWWWASGRSPSRSMSTTSSGSPTLCSGSVSRSTGSWSFSVRHLRPRA